MSEALATLPAPPPIGAAARMSVTATDPLAFNFHPKQARYELSRCRFNVIPAGRRSGKTWIAKRRGCKMALQNTYWPDFRIAFTCPTYAQVKRVYWDDLHRILRAHDKNLIADDSKTDLMIKLVNGSEIWLIGMDKPDRFEGPSWNWVFVDEAPNTKKEAIVQHILPALSERLGGMDEYGVPEGHNHYYKDAKFAIDEEKVQKHMSEWAYHWWRSRDVMPLYLGEEAAEAEIESARRRMDEITFRQEYEAEFIHFLGRAYYEFDRSIHAGKRLLYDPSAPLHLCFDFNVEPGVAVCVQEGLEQRREIKRDETLVIADHTIRKNSNTQRICQAIIKQWRDHKGLVYCYGDASGGARGSAKVVGSDWDIIKILLRKVFGARLNFRVPRRNPSVRAGVNAVNSRLMSANGDARLFVDPANASETADDLDETQVLKDGSGGINKKADDARTHHTDALRAYVWKRHPIAGSEKIENKAI